MNSRREIVAIPIKNFDAAKSRLSPVLARGDVSKLARSLAVGVIQACSPRTCAVLCDDDDVERFARDMDVRVVRVSAGGLNDAVSDGYKILGHDYEDIIVAHGDLAHPSGLGNFEFDFRIANDITLVTDRHGDGTNVLALPSGLDFNFGYGPHSAQRHQREAERLGLRISIMTDSPWGLDIDTPEDFQELAK